MDWELIRLQKQKQIIRYSTRENKYRAVYDYKVGDKFIITYHAAYKYEMPYKVPFVIIQCFNNGTVNLQYGATEITHTICRIKPYKSDTKVEDLYTIDMNDAVNIQSPVIYFCFEY